MPHYIGSNDRDTLLGVIEEIDRRLSSIRHQQPGAKLVRNSARLAGAVAELVSLREDIVDATRRGPTPTPEQLTGLRIVVPEPSRLRIKASGLARALGCTIRFADDMFEGVSNWKYKLGEGIWSPGYATEVEMLTVAIAQLEGAAERIDLEAAHRNGLHRAPGVDGCPLCDEILRGLGYAMMGIPPGDPRRTGEEES